ncbi:hypothetical protein TTHERM_00865440 (macronuclear) [Tetrahymena thermophila SB210]|uniref:IC97/Casc1 N-terminal domain-containing protein n=1 Tax=Tetrahymena thermophila (strain SB210) TaxID=312017 RepID=Q24FB9_TETTS|nr:hypothetical protein TTHERM_00865440 [Tetrahymena thermophila SB210]EAS06539.2 hypothetical protein TTHERM_00865440 [Tetrahymena thermophila SB210]|eukprot:XP_001026784.2 hypothetical protein TTHERM_00865440 [Tetrahymena thermophila SB210]
MEFQSMVVQKPKKKEERGQSKEQKGRDLPSRPQLAVSLKKASLSQDVRQNSVQMKPAGSSILVKKGTSLTRNDKKDKEKKQSKKKKKEELLEKKRLLDEEERKKYMEEERRRFELERFRRLQEEKLTKEEKERLVLESQAEEEFALRFQARVYYEEKKKKIWEEWQRYLECIDHPYPESEKSQTEYLYRYDEQNEINELDKIEFYLKKSDYSETVVDNLFQHYYINQADNKYEKISFFDKFITKIRKITLKKIQQISALVIKNQEVFFDDKNEQLIQQDKLPITPDNLRSICGAITLKPEERYKYEIFKTFESDDFQMAFWWSPIEKCGYRMKLVEFKRPNVGIEMPRNINTLSIYMRCIWTRQDYLSPLHSIQKYLITGGVFNIESFNMVPLIKRRKKYAIKVDFGTEEQIDKPLKYPPEVGGSIANFPALKGYIELPKKYYLGQNFSPQVAYYSQEQGWTTDGIEVTKYDPDLRIITFTTKTLAPLACVQDVCLDYPYQSFMLRCVQEDLAILDLQTKRLKLKFEIGADDVTLVDENNSLGSIFSHIVNKPMTYAALLYELHKIGVNLIPESQHAFLCDVPQKEIDVENKALLELMMIIKAFAVRNNQDNKMQGEDKILLEIRQNMDYSYKPSPLDDELEWVKTAIWCNKCAFIKDQSKSIETINASNFLNNSTSHAMVSLIIEQHQNIFKNSSDIVDKMNDVYVSDFQNNMRRFLKTLRLLSFT